MTWEKNLITYRREKASTTLRDARILFEAKSFHSAVNRIYYAMFYEVSALLLTRKISASKHTGVRAKFAEHFIKTGIVSKDIGRFYSKMFDFRQEGDYDDFVYFEEEKVKIWLETAEKYIKILEELLDK